MTDIIQDRIGLGNLQPLSQPLNSSKSASLKWTKFGGEELNEVYVANLQAKQKNIERKIIQQISVFNKLNAEGL